MSKKIVIVETLSIFKMKYAVEVKEESHALDEVVCNLGNPDFIELSQTHLDEVISGSTVVTEEEYLKVFNKDNDYLSSWSDEQKFKMINKVDYTEHGGYTSWDEQQGKDSVKMQSMCRGDKDEWEFS